MESLTSVTHYYRFKGEVNTNHVLTLAFRRALDPQVAAVVVPSETGRSALKALEKAEKLGVRLVVITHPPDETWGPRGSIPIGLLRPEYSDAREKLEKAGVKIVQGSRPFAPPSRSLGWDKAVPETLIDKLLGGLLGQGVKIAVEAALMAADAGAVERGDIVVSLGGTYKGLDAAIVARTTYSYRFLDEFEILEILAKPWSPRVSLPEYTDPNWRGDLDRYYEGVGKKPRGLDSFL